MCTPAPTVYGIKLVPVDVTNQQENSTNTPPPDSTQSSTEKLSVTVNPSHCPVIGGISNSRSAVVSRSVESQTVESVSIGVECGHSLEQLV